MAAPCPLLGDGITDDTLLHIAGFLPTARDLLCLKLTNTRFCAKCIAAAPVSAAGGAAAAPEMLCIAEEAGRRWVAGCSEQERGWAPRWTKRGRSWLCLMQEVELLRVPLVFCRAHASLTLSEGGAVATRDLHYGAYRTAASKAVMRSGRHFVQFTVLAGNPMFGVIRAGWDVEGGESAYSAHGHCFYDTFIGTRFPGGRTWEDVRTAIEQGDSIGMLLDLDQGSMTVWKNDVRLGVMQAEGLVGPLCWAVSLDDGGDSARSESTPAPDSPTEEELAAAKEFMRQQRRLDLGLPLAATDAECEAREQAEAEADDY